MATSDYFKIVKMPDGTLQNRWIAGGLFDSQEVVGDVMRDADGNIEDGLWLVWDEPTRTISINQTLKTQILAQRAAKETQREALKLEREQIISQLKQLYQDIQDATTAAQIKAVLLKIVRLLGLIYAEQ